MDKLKIGIIGLGKIGKFHAREFSKLNCEVVSVLDRTEENAEKAVTELRDLYSIKALPNHEIDKFLDTDNMDAVSIATPAKVHDYYIEACLAKGLNVFCEKPLVFNSVYKNYQRAKELFALAEKKGKMLVVNTQWPSVLPKIKQYLPSKPSEIKSFYMLMEPGVKGIGMLIEHLAHTNSLLVNLISGGKAKNIRFPIKEDNHIIVEFDYDSRFGTCKVRYDLEFNEDTPREVVFSINNKKFRRLVGKGYKQVLMHEGKVIKIEDPFTVSIRKFVEAVKGKGGPLVTKQEILENLKLQDDIIREYSL